MAHGNGNGRGRSSGSRSGRGARTGGWNDGGGGCGGGCGGCGGGSWGGGWAPPCGGWGGCGWGGGCGGYCGSQTVVPWPYPVMVPSAPPAPAYAAPYPYPPVTGCVDAYGANTGCGLPQPATGAFGDRIAAAIPIMQDVRNVSSSVQSLMPALQNARDSMQRIRERMFPAQPAATPAATPFGYAAEPFAAPAPIAQPVAVCPDRACVVYELRALDDVSGAAVRTAQVPDKTPIEVLGDTTGVIAIEGNVPRRWSHVRLRATDGSTIEGWMKPESLVAGAPSGPVGTSTGCACEKLSAEVDGTSIGKGILPGTQYHPGSRPPIGTSAVPLSTAPNLGTFLPWFNRFRGRGRGRYDFRYGR